MALVAGKALQKRVTLWNSAMAAGLPYERLSCSKIVQMLIDEFHPIILAEFDTLHWSPVLLMRVRKHALLMLMKER